MFNMERFSKDKCNGKHLITICCQCKRIKDQRSEKWFKIFYYPPNIDISHAYCLPCVKQLYPEIYEAVA